MRLPDLITDKIEFTSRSAVREKVAQSAAQRKLKLDTKALDAWATSVSEKVARLGRLMSDQQLADYRLGRRLVKGDRARFIADTRSERTLNGQKIVRPQGQLGHVLDVRAAEGELVIVRFMPDKPTAAGEDASSTIVTLEAPVMSCGWPLLERIANINEVVA